MPWEKSWKIISVRPLLLITSAQKLDISTACAIVERPRQNSCSFLKMKHFSSTKVEMGLATMCSSSLTTMPKREIGV